MAKAKVTANRAVKYFPDQFDDEEVLYVFRKHPFVMRAGIVWGSLGLLVGPLYTLILTYVHANSPPSLTFFYLSFLASLGLAGLLFFPSWMSWYYSVFIVTNQRFIQITQKGFFHRSVVDMGLNQIQMVNYEISGLQETLLGFGTIMMQTFVGDLVIHYLHHPQHIQKRILEILRKEGVAVADSPALQTN
ncbi:MAG TPA: PH domain-containing protein [Candidatus Saccharimonadales bacterium]|nr:PH domain-containing protein [Candidatus Saccharimonadales bacterium]